MVFSNAAPCYILLGIKEDIVQTGIATDAVVFSVCLIYAALHYLCPNTPRFGVALILAKAIPQ